MRRRRRITTLLITTVDSIVDFILKGVQNVGSNLPGIGVVAVVLAAKDKVMVCDRLSETMYLSVSRRDSIDRPEEIERR